VRFEDVDSFKVVHNSKYFCFFERGRLEYLRNLGFVNDGENSIKNFEVAIVENFCAYHKPALFDDLMKIHLRVPFIKNTSLQYQYLITKGKDRTLLTSGYSNLVYFDREAMKPKRIPNEIKLAIQRHEGANLGQMTGKPGKNKI
jgi:acyl-CoA thioester hydrolase